MPRYRQDDIDLVVLEGEGYHVHASIGGEYIAALMHRLTRDLIWDQSPEFARILEPCRKPIGGIDNSGGAPC